MAERSKARSLQGRLDCTTSRVRIPSPPPKGRGCLEHSPHTTSIDHDVKDLTARHPPLNATRILSRFLRILL